MREMLPVMRHLLHTMRIFAVTEDRNMNAMATHWDIAQQPQKEEEMFMIAKPSTRRVYFVGPSSTGKTTMVNVMAKSYPQARIHKELARNIMKKHNITLQSLEGDVSTVAWLQREIIRQHAKLMAGQWCNLSRYSELEFYDRCLIDALAFCKQRVGEDAYQDVVKSKEFQNFLPAYRDMMNTRFVLFGAVEDFRTDDGIRLVASNHQQHVEEQLVYEKILNDLKIPFVVLSESNPDERKDKICRIVDELCHNRVQ